MKRHNFFHLAIALGIISTFAGCASTNVTSREQLVSGARPRPANIWVCDFAATPGEVPADSPVAGELAKNSPPQTADQIATGRALGSTIATQLAQRIRDMGLASTRVTKVTTPQVNDIVIR